MPLDETKGLMVAKIPLHEERVGMVDQLYRLATGSKSR